MSGPSTRARLRLRWLVALILGAAAGAGATTQLGIAAGLLAGWAVLALVSAGWTLVTVWPMDAAQTRAHAAEEDPGRKVARAIAIVGSVASLAAVLVVMFQGRQASGVDTLLLAGTALLSVVASWLQIQTDYMLRYAAMYYIDGAGGIDFNQQADPEYTDFAYFSVGLGMTYQVSDTNVTRNAVRRVVIAQTVLGYLFGTGIVATVINLVTSLG